MIADQAAADGARSVDTYTPTAAHDMCKPTGERWIEPLIAPAPAAPAHPNAQGQQTMAATVEHAVRCAAHRR
ncbi:hypothetical protein [Streptomyces sp. NBC_00343]|uniref:hypothetical protein n=1 Tax=Streptomyces sp. NBC_00343 TaxID=2975719 RepID=UPI002E2836F9|nr:hypothetical protein [Streptomyces sp. NBC_00343]